MNPSEDLDYDQSVQAEGVGDGSSSGSDQACCSDQEGQGEEEEEEGGGGVIRARRGLAHSRARR